MNDGDKYWVPTGAFNKKDGAKMKKHSFGADKAEWDEICGEAAQHEGFFPVYS